MTNIAACLSTGNNEWRTPPPLYRFLCPWGGATVDAACTLENRLAERGITAQENALLVPWGTMEDDVWCNPPYGRLLLPFVRRAINQAPQVRSITLLIPARTDTKAFRELWDSPYCREIAFLQGRVSFLLPDGTTAAPAPFPSMVARLQNTSWDRRFRAPDVILIPKERWSACQ